MRFGTRARPRLCVFLGLSPTFIHPHFDYDPAWKTCASQAAGAQRFSGIQILPHPPHIFAQDMTVSANRSEIAMAERAS